MGCFLIPRNHHRKEFFMTKEYLDLKPDFMFKQLFGHPSRKTITIGFLNDWLGRIGNQRIVVCNLKIQN